MSSVVISGDTSGAITLAAPSVAGSSTLTLPAGTGTVSVNGVSSNIVASTAQATTSGTSITFSSIPSWVKRITVIFNGVSISGTAIGLVRLGTASGIESTGYAGAVSYLSAAASITSSTTGIPFGLGSATDTLSGNMIITNISGNIWVASHTSSLSSGTQIQIAASNKTLGGLLTQLSITTSNGTDTFDAGSVNILYE